MPIFGDLMEQESWGTLTPRGVPGDLSVSSLLGVPTFYLVTIKATSQSRLCEGICQDSHSSVKKTVLPGGLGEPPEQGLSVRWCQDHVGSRPPGKKATISKSEFEDSVQGVRGLVFQSLFSAPFRSWATSNAKGASSSLLLLVAVPGAMVWFSGIPFMEKKAMLMRLDASSFCKPPTLSTDSIPVAGKSSCSWQKHCQLGRNWAKSSKPSKTRPSLYWNPDSAWRILAELQLGSALVNVTTISQITHSLNKTQFGLRLWDINWKGEKSKRGASGELPTKLVLLLNTYASMHFWQKNPKLWKWNWPSLASLFMITGYTGILRNAEVSQSWMLAIMCLSFSLLKVVDDPVGAGFPCLCMLKGLLQLHGAELGANKRESSCQEFLFLYLPIALVRQPKCFPNWEENHLRTPLLHCKHPEADSWLEILVSEYEIPNSIWALLNQSHLPLGKKQGIHLL